MSSEELAGLNALQSPPRIRVVRSLRQWIEGGRLGSGDLLPSEHRLASQLDVSRTTIRAALRQLEDEGVIRAAEGRGKMVAETARSGGGSLMTETVVIFAQPTMAPPVPVGKPHAGLEGVIQMGVIERLKDARINTLCLHADEIEIEQVAHLLQDRPRGIIALRAAVQSAEGRAALDALRGAKVPAVVYGDAPMFSETDTLVSDHDAGSYELTKWLIGQGKRRIVRFWQMPAEIKARPEWLRRRDAGYVRAVEESGLPVLAAVEVRSFPTEPTTADQFEMAAQLTAGQIMPHLRGENAADAIMCVSDGVVASVIAACRLCGKQPHDDVAVVGYDANWSDLAFSRWEPTPPLASVDKRNFSVGRGLADLLLERINGTLSPAPQHRRMAPRLIVHGE